MKKIVNSILLVIGAICFLNSCSDNYENKEQFEFDFGSAVYEEPFVGILSSKPSILVKSMQYPPYSWFAPDTTRLEKSFEITFNEDCLRSQSEATLMFRDLRYNPVKGITLYHNGEICLNEEFSIKADAPLKTLNLSVVISPLLKEYKIEGCLLIKGTELDAVNEQSLLQENNFIGNWKCQQEIGWPVMLWLLWLLTVILVVLVICAIVYMVSLAVIMLPLFTLSSAGAIQAAIAYLYECPYFVFKLVHSLLPSKMKHYLKENFKVYKKVERGIVKPNTAKQKQTLKNIKKQIGKDLKYKYGEPDFTPVAEHQERLEGYLDDNVSNGVNVRPKVHTAQDNAAQLMLKSKSGRQRIAEYVGKQSEDVVYGDYTAWKDDSLNFGKKDHNPLTPHETIDGKYIQWVPKKYHDSDRGGIPHFGGVARLAQIRQFFNLNI